MKTKNLLTEKFYCTKRDTLCPFKQKTAGPQMRSMSSSKLRLHNLIQGQQTSFGIQLSYRANNH